MTHLMFCQYLFDYVLLGNLFAMALAYDLGKRDERRRLTPPRDRHGRFMRRG